ncbi:hypothetical protein CERZMDRAFT_85947 [Cercospora zeae-maydis SCOH1-5]|uniref:Uncharacterized protein n=1 Tax=Cercospora zeae-maydis SCOH1-5 TaxID=717836 RepID=A0A6A6FB66_9PEZI|nr:hypothetical protein CERZMDRAFT_85947 [Cercospora zeae-maydis SCOH1-5]
MSAQHLFDELRSAQARIDMLTDDIIDSNHAYTNADLQVLDAEHELQSLQRINGYDVRRFTEMTKCANKLNMFRQHRSAVQEHLLRLWRELEAVVNSKENLWADIEIFERRIRFTWEKAAFLREKAVLAAEDDLAQEAHWRRHMFGKTRQGQDRSIADEARVKCEEGQSRRDAQGPLPPLTVNPAALHEWQRYVLQCFSNYGLIDGFPDPCSGPVPVVTPCNRPRCNQEERTLIACSCQLRKTFEAAGVDLKKEWRRWHPDRFQVCAEQRRQLYTLMATEVFRVVNDMRTEVLQRMG